jgi:hypothetical protein
MLPRQAASQPQPVQMMEAGSCILLEKKNAVMCLTMIRFVHKFEN